MKVRSIFDKDLFVPCAIMFALWTGYCGYYYGHNRHYYGKPEVREYDNAQRDAVRHGDHTYTCHLINHSLVLYLNDEYELSARQMEILLAEDSLCSQGWFVQGLIYSDIKCWGEAIPCFERSVRLNPGDKIWVAVNNDTCSNARAELVIRMCRDSLRVHGVE